MPGLFLFYVGLGFVSTHRGKKKNLLCFRAMFTQPTGFFPLLKKMYHLLLYKNLRHVAAVFNAALWWLIYEGSSSQRLHPKSIRSESSFQKKHKHTSCLSVQIFHQVRALYSLACFWFSNWILCFSKFCLHLTCDDKRILHFYSWLQLSLQSIWLHRCGSG